MKFPIWKERLSRLYHGWNGMLGILNCKIGFKMPFQGYQIFRNPGKQGKSYKKWFTSIWKDTINVWHIVWKLLKCHILIFEFWPFPPIVVLLKLTCLVTLFLTASFRFSKTRQNWPFFDIFKKLLSTQNVNLAHFARSIEWDFFCDFQTPCQHCDRVIYYLTSPLTSIQEQISTDCSLPWKQWLWLHLCHQ